MAIEFEYRPKQQEWISTSAVHLFGSDLEAVLEDETGLNLESQQTIFLHAMEIIPRLDAECRQRLFQFYIEACENFPDFLGTELLPVINNPNWVDDVFGFGTLIVPTQMENRGMTFKLAGGCTWDGEHGVQLFFRNGTLEHVDSDAALYW